jgi:hypothetical protein
MGIQKNFKFTDEMLSKFNELKEKEKVTSDAEFLRKMLEYTELMQKEREEKTTKVTFEEYKELQRQYQALLVELGRLQGELNIYKQKALPKKSFFKRLFGID